MRPIYIEKDITAEVKVHPFEIVDELNTEGRQQLLTYLLKKLYRNDATARYGNTLQETLITEELLELKQKLNIHELSALNQKIDSVKPLLT